MQQKILDDVLHTLRNRPNMCITFPVEFYRGDVCIMLVREGRTWRLHRYLAHVLGAPMGRYMLPNCRTFGCMNPWHRAISNATSLHPVRTTCPNGHPYTAKNTRPKSSKTRCVTCHEARLARRRTTDHRVGWCRQGHELTPFNTYTWTRADGTTGRRCKKCHLARVNARRQRKEHQ